MIGCTVFLVTRHHVHGIGLVGMELQQSSIVSVDFYTTKKRMHAIGHKMLADAKNIVSMKKFNSVCIGCIIIDFF